VFWEMHDGGWGCGGAWGATAGAGRWRQWPWLARTAPVVATIHVGWRRGTIAVGVVLIVLAVAESCWLYLFQTMAVWRWWGQRRTARERQVLR
jgi:hypothetical protein